MPKTGKIFYDNRSTKTEEFNRLYEKDATYPPLFKKQNTVIYSQDFTLNNDGITTSMVVDGSVSKKQFIIQPNSSNDVYISSLSFVLTARLVITELGEFGGAPALTNGCRLVYEIGDLGEITIADQIRTNYDFVEMCLGVPDFGLVATDAFKLTNVIDNTDEGYFTVLKFAGYGYDREYVGGIRLRANSSDKIIFEINDNLVLGTNNVARFNAKAFGYTRIIE